MAAYLYTGEMPTIKGEGITHVIVQDGVESIEDRAFEDWIDLVSVHIPSSVTRIGKCAFQYCYSLSSINLPTSLQHIGEYAFDDCDSLSVIDLPDSLVDIGKYAFNGCSSLSSITIPQSMTIIQEGTFEDCISLSQVIIPPSVIDIGQNAFWGCSSLTSIKLPTGIQTIDEGAFYNCDSLETIQIPPSTISICDRVFKGCSSLKIVYVPPSAIYGSSHVLDIFDRKTDSVDFFEENLIIFTYDSRFVDWFTIITVESIHQCIQGLPNHDIPIDEQLDALHHVFHQQLPDLADKAQQSGFNLLHILVHFPLDIYDPLSILLTKCPQATIAVDWKGKTPLHRAIESTKHNMDVKIYDLLLRHSPDRVVHRAVEAGLHGDDLHELVNAKINALTLEDDHDSGLLPFMVAAKKNSRSEFGCGSRLLFLTASYELLSMDPSVLQDFIST